MTGFALTPLTKRLTFGQPFVLESGEVLPQVEIAYRTWGHLAPGADNAVVVCHALTGSADADDWWAPLFGPGRPLDTDRDFIVCSNVLGGCYGSTGPASAAPDGRPWGARFPQLTVRDQVRAQMALADALGIRRIRFVIGGSMGGLQALEWAVLDPERVAAVVSIAAAGRHSPWCLAWSEAQRMALSADPQYRNGDFDRNDPRAAPRTGLAAARAVAMVSYRSPAALEARFGRASGRQVIGDKAERPEDFAVRAWLRYHGDALVKRFDAHSYRILLDAMDSHDLGRGRASYAAVLARLELPVLVGSIRSDALYVPADQQALVAGLPQAQLMEVDSLHGHDGFLIDAARFELPLQGFIASLGRSAARGSQGRADRQQATPSGGQLKYAY